MTSNNEVATDHLEEVSGRWLRDQLREVSDPPAPELLGPSPVAEASTTQLIEGLARSITTAVVEPMRGLEARRETRQQKLEDAVLELSTKMGEAFVEIAKLRDQFAAAASKAEESRNQVQREIQEVRTQAKSEIDAVREQYKSEIETAQTQAKGEIEAVRVQAKSEVEALGSEAKNEIEALRGGSRHDMDQANAAIADLRSSFSNLAEEIGRMQGKVREQHERIDALRFRETQRAKAMNELAKASSSLKEAVAAAAAMSAASEEEPMTENRG